VIFIVEFLSTFSALDSPVVTGGPPGIELAQAGRLLQRGPPD